MMSPETPGGIYMLMSSSFNRDCYRRLRRSGAFPRFRGLRCRDWTDSFFSSQPEKLSLFGSAKLFSFACDPISFSDFEVRGTACSKAWGSWINTPERDIEKLARYSSASSNLVQIQSVTMAHRFDPNFTDHVINSMGPKTPPRLTPADDRLDPACP